MKSLFEELGGTYTLGKDGMYYPNLMIEEADQHPIGKMGTDAQGIPEGAASEPLSTAHSERAFGRDFGQASRRCQRESCGDA